MTEKYSQWQIITIKHTWDLWFKVRPVIDFFNKQFLAMYNSGRDQSIDEAMVPYKGRSSLKQYMPKKLIKWGFKVWVRAEADINMTAQKKTWGQSCKKSNTKIYSKYHHIDFDNYFSSVDLMLDLLRPTRLLCQLLDCLFTVDELRISTVRSKGLNPSLDTETMNAICVSSIEYG